MFISFDLRFAFIIITERFVRSKINILFEYTLFEKQIIPRTCCVQCRSYDGI